MLSPNAWNNVLLASSSSPDQMTEKPQQHRSEVSENHQEPVAAAETSTSTSDERSRGTYFYLFIIFIFLIIVYVIYQYTAHVKTTAVMNTIQNKTFHL